MLLSCRAACVLVHPISHVSPISTSSANILSTQRQSSSHPATTTWPFASRPSPYARCQYLARRDVRSSEENILPPQVAVVDQIGSPFRTKHVHGHRRAWAGTDMNRPNLNKRSDTNKWPRLHRRAPRREKPQTQAPGCPVGLPRECSTQHANVSC
jgi:hypothetical protein